MATASGFKLDAFDFLLTELFNHFCRSAEGHVAVRDGLAARDERSGADDAVAADNRAVHDDRAHADQRIVTDRAAVDQAHMADGDAVPNPDRVSRRNVKGTEVLDIGPRADRDRPPRLVAADDRIVPDAALRADGDVVADDLYAVRDESAFIDIVHDELLMTDEKR